MQRERLGNLQAQNRRNTAQIYAMQQEISRLASGIGKRFSKFSIDGLVLLEQTKYSMIWCFFQVRGQAQMRAVCVCLNLSSVCTLVLNKQFAENGEANLSSLRQQINALPNSDQTNRIKVVLIPFVTSAQYTYIPDKRLLHVCIYATHS